MRRRDIIRLLGGTLAWPLTLRLPREAGAAWPAPTCYPIDVCIYCAYLLASRMPAPEQDRHDWSFTAIDARWGSDWSFALADEEAWGGSWSPCDLCGDERYGPRWRAVALVTHM
jgi:hypothetical protein